MPSITKRTTITLGSGVGMVWPAGMGYARVSRALLSLGHEAGFSKRFIHEICSDRISIVRRILNSMDENHRGQLVRRIGNAFSDESRVTVFNLAYDLFLDGASIKDRITAATIRCDEDRVFNDIRLESIDPSLFRQADPAVNPKAGRIQVQLGARVLHFLVEERTGPQDLFSITGRSPSAKTTSPHAGPIVYFPDADTPASVLARDLAEGAAPGLELDWQADDYLVPKTWLHEGYPLRGIARLAHEIGAVVRSRDDGSLLVRNRFPVRPIHMQKARPEASFADDRIIELQVSKSHGTGHNRVRVIGYSEEVDLPVMVLEDGSDGGPFKGDEAFVRVYWNGPAPAALPETYVTAGWATFLGRHSETVAEVLEFRNGQARVSKPIAGDLNVDWIGDRASGVEWEPFTRDLVLQGATGGGPDSRYRVCRATFRADYWQYRLAGHNVERLLMALAVPGRPDVTVDVMMGAGDLEAPFVEAPFLTSRAAAVARGKAELDKARYDTKTITILTPYCEEARDGALVKIEDAEMAVSGICHVRRVEILFDGPMVLNRLECVRVLT